MINCVFFHVQVAETMYDDLSDDQELLRMEMALAQRELMEYERSVTNKRKKIAYVIHNWVHAALWNYLIAVVVS